MRAWYAANRRHGVESSRAYRVENSDTISTARKASRRADPRREMLTNAKRRAARKGLPFALTLEDIRIPANCPVLGIPLEVCGKAFSDRSPSLDRLVPSLGYVPGNVEVISNRANLLKRDGSLEEVRAVLRYMKARCG
ncbi:hypothetical protein [Coralloluteibacterium stylophorae]|uniref:Uncharacterized protein n=1 Tax=Coralloluteibacterium stylophorae TaxID=1776034 RepID=A0A8J7VQZ3_9GAMM|nr:hypothetical protein [Coralloluteibacterium stylophorae]MBS7457703.1 hypothetical protein [Coralloluteibacterium stylophorae]